MSVILINSYRYAAAGGGGGSGQKTITIDHTKCGAADSSNFPMLFSGTYTYLKTVGNGGSVQNANGYDIGFYSDAGLTTKLKWEVERYVASTGEFIAWVKIPTLSHTADTVIYLGYGDVSITTDQSDRTNVWDSSYSAVYHLKDGTTLDGADATSFANDLAAFTTVPTATTGLIDGGANFVAASGQAIRAADVTSLQMTTLFTLEAWIKPTSFADYRVILCKGTGPQKDYTITTNITTGELIVQFSQGALNFKSVVSTAVCTANAWNRVMGTYDGSQLTAYVNGAAGVSAAASGSVDTTSAGLTLGMNGNQAQSFFDGVIDEVRISKGIARTHDWDTACYNNQGSPSTFYTLT